ncbi:DUF6809 family protein [Agathobaculum sp.]|uniref:DUF6809 family protein n=1 Tax=Agathobaculum sp. TaxID=2048138 RepID=UPI002A7FE427|nr:DUF6809 family protein [Agathobaculum sp.]MDY3617616.1 hypothetical protein [Agathobaculum sp.]
MYKIYEAMHTHILQELPPAPDHLGTAMEEREKKFRNSLSEAQQAAYKRLTELEAQYDARQELSAFRDGFACAAALLLDAQKSRL